MGFAVAAAVGATAFTFAEPLNITCASCLNCTVAVSAMARIGLDRETLARKDASVGEVKRFLDTLYKDDQTVLGEFSDEEWSEGKPPQPALQARVWATTVAVVKRNGKVRVVRDSALVWTGTIASLRRVKDDVKEVTSGFECGIALEGFNDVKEKDILECFELEETAAVL